MQHEINTVDTGRLTVIEEKIKSNKKFITVKDIAIERVDKAYEDRKLK